MHPSLHISRERESSAWCCTAHTYKHTHSQTENSCVAFEIWRHEFWFCVPGSGRRKRSSHTHTHTHVQHEWGHLSLTRSCPGTGTCLLCAVPGWIFCYKFKFLIIICKKMFNLDINHVRAGVLGLSSTDIRPGGGRRSRSRWDDGCWMWVLLCVRSGDDELRFHHQGRENALEGRMAQRAP